MFKYEYQMDKHSIILIPSHSISSLKKDYWTMKSMIKVHLNRNIYKCTTSHRRAVRTHIMSALQRTLIGAHNPPCSLAGCYQDAS